MSVNTHEPSLVPLDGDELAAVYWALDYYLCDAYAKGRLKPELKSGAERAQTIVSDWLRLRSSV